MNSDAKIGLGAVGLLAVCCGGPLILSLLASGAVLSGLGAVWDGGRLLLLVGAAVLVVGAVRFLAHRRASRAAGDGVRCASPLPTVGTGHRDEAAAHSTSVDGERAPVESRGRSGAD